MGTGSGASGGQCTDLGAKEHYEEVSLCSVEVGNNFEAADHVLHQVDTAAGVAALTPSSNVDEARQPVNFNIINFTLNK